MAYQMDMSKEKEPEVLFTEGDHEFVVMTAREAVSKNNNTQIIATLISVKGKDTKTVYMITVEGKRWMLKSFLSACGIEKDPSTGKYNWDFPDIIGKHVVGVIKNVEEEWTDREGQTQKTPKSKIARFRALEEKSEDVSKEVEKEWDA